MGLTISHGAFDGAYSAFDRLRKAIAIAAGIEWPPHDDLSLDQNLWYWPDEGVGPETNPGLDAFFNHSDCNGTIPPDIACKVADEIEALLPEIPDGGDGHLARVGGYKGATKLLIEGFRLAASAGEPIEFC